jgi:hypothetical protein
MRALLWALTLLFAARVAGQALQEWRPQEFLPPADTFQGSNLPYGVLLTTQLAILGAMAYVSARVGDMARRPGLGKWLAAAGALYITVALGRIGVGMLVPEAPAWFLAWIPAAFHVVLASFVLAVSVYHLRKPLLR